MKQVSLVVFIFLWVLAGCNAEKKADSSIANQNKLAIDETASLFTTRIVNNETYTTLVVGGLEFSFSPAQYIIEQSNSKLNILDSETNELIFSIPLNKEIKKENLLVDGKILKVLEKETSEGTIRIALYNIKKTNFFFRERTHSVNYKISEDTSANTVIVKNNSTDLNTGILESPLLSLSDEDGQVVVNEVQRKEYFLLNGMLPALQETSRNENEIFYTKLKTINIKEENSRNFLTNLKLKKISNDYSILSFKISRQDDLAFFVTTPSLNAGFKSFKCSALFSSESFTTSRFENGVLLKIAIRNDLAQECFTSMGAKGKYKVIDEKLNNLEVSYGVEIERM